MKKMNEKITRILVKCPKCGKTIDHLIRMFPVMQYEHAFMDKDYHMHLEAKEPSDFLDDDVPATLFNKYPIYLCPYCMTEINIKDNEFSEFIMSNRIKIEKEVE